MPRSIAEIKTNLNGSGLIAKDPKLFQVIKDILDILILGLGGVGDDGNGIANEVAYFTADNKLVGSPFVNIVNDRLKITRSSATSPVITKQGETQGTLDFDASVGFQQIGFGMDNYVASSLMPAYLWIYDPTGLGGGGLELLTGETIGNALTYSKAQGFAHKIDGGSPVLVDVFHVYQYGGLGTGPVAGLCVLIDRNDSGAGAASSLGLVDLNGVNYYLWVDATGVLRIGPARPTENGSVSDTSGAPV